MSTFRHIIGSVYKYIKMFLSKLRHDAVSAYAANAAFFILVSIFPFLILTVTVINAVLPESYFTIALTAASPSTVTITTPAGAEIVALSEETTVLATV